MFGGVGLHPVSCVENFNEDNLEFTKYDRRNIHSLPRFSTQANQSNKTSLKKGKAQNSRGSIRQVGINLNLNQEQPVTESSGRVNTVNSETEKDEFTKDNSRFYHLMLPYKHYLLVYGGQSNAGGLANRAFRPVHCEIFLYDLHSHRWQELIPKNQNRVIESRRNHCGAILGEWLIVYGGLNTCLNYLDDLQAFNF